MKYFSTFLWLILISFQTSLMAQVYVNANATGTNNGSSWTDAFTELSTAIDSAQAGDQIWVAAGTYLPGSSPSATFSISQNLELYGGFAGTETLLSERNDSLNPTILSGDLNGDDISEDWVSNKADNAHSVIILSVGIDTTTIIDGFTIRNGYANTVSAVAGGINAKGSPVIQNCLLTENYSQNGGAAMHFDGGGTNGTRVRDCRFVENKTDQRGGGIAFLNVFGTGTTVENCHFEDNYAQETGGGLSVVNSNLDVLNSTFINNTAEFLGGGCGVYAPNGNRSVFFEGCLFENNTSTLGGGVYAEPEGPNFSIMANHCQFKSNTVALLRTGYSPTGAGFYVFYDPVSSFGMTRIIGCDFEDNAAVFSGAGLTSFFYGQNCSTVVDSCTFSGNTLSATTGATRGGGLSVYSTDPNTYFEVQHSDFQANSGGIAGALNLAVGSNGVLNTWVNDCHFSSNETLEYGAGISVVAFNGAQSAQHLIENCSFQGNRFIPSSRQTHGAGIGIVSSIDSLQTTIRNCVFTNNQNPKGGAAVEVWRGFTGIPQQMDIKVENSLFSQHGNGQAVLQFSRLAQTTLTNLTLADNGIPALRLIDDASVQMRNNIFYSPTAADIQVSTNSNLISLGGNLVSDSSASAYLTAQDLEGQDPAFKGSGDHPYQIAFTSPAVDLGQYYPGFDPSALDLAGNIRPQGTGIDAGSYESPFFTSIRDQMAANQNLQLYPVPARAFTTLELENEWRGQLTLAVYNAAGQLQQAQVLSKNNQLARWEIDLTPLPAGHYQLVLNNGKAKVSRALVKVNN